MSETIFRIAETPDDYARCQQLIVAHGLEYRELTIPTIMALREGRLIGLLGTQKDSQAVVAGPLVTDLPAKTNAGFLNIQLLELYDNAMRRLGISFYNFAVNEKAKKQLHFVHQVTGASIIMQQDGYIWFKREL